MLMLAYPDLIYSAGNIVRLDAPEIETLTAGKNRSRELVHLGCCEDEFNVLRRLFERFEQSVESTDREHMHLVDNINPVLCTNGSIVSFLTQITDIVNAVVTCGVNLDNVKYCARINAAANLTFVAGVTVNQILAVNCLGKYLCTACLTRSS